MLSEKAAVTNTEPQPATTESLPTSHTLTTTTTATTNSGSGSVSVTTSKPSQPLVRQQLLYLTIHFQYSFSHVSTYTHGFRVVFH